MPKPPAGEAQKPTLRRAMQEHLGDGERDELGVGDPWETACAGPRRQEIVHQHVKCREQAVKVGEHEATSVVDVALATPTFDSRCISPRVEPIARANSESVI